MQTERRFPDSRVRTLTDCTNVTVMRLPQIIGNANIAAAFAASHCAMPTEHSEPYIPQLEVLLTSGLDAYEVR